MDDTFEEDALGGEEWCDVVDEPTSAPSAKGPKLGDSLYEGSQVTMVQACLMIFQFCLKNHLTTKAISELLLLLKAFLPQTIST